MCVLENSSLASAESKPSVSGFDSVRSCNEINEKRRLPLQAVAAAKDIEFAATQRSAIPFGKESIAFFTQPKTDGPAAVRFLLAYTLSSVMASLLKSREMHHRDASPTRV